MIPQTTPVPVIQQPVPVIQQPVPVVQQPVPVIPQPVPVVSSSTSMVTTSKLNVRSGPSTKYGKIGVLQTGSPVCVLGSSGSWYKINYNGLVGYVSSKYVQKGTVTVTGYVTPVDSTMITNSPTTVYKGTGRQYGELGAFPAGYSVHVVGICGGWYKVAFGNSYGYVPRAYLSNFSDLDVYLDGFILRAY